MLFVNEHEVEDYRRLYRAHPVLGPATATLSRLVNAVNENSDGWPYWSAPSKAARKLVELIVGDPGMRLDDVRADATPAKLKAAYTPLRSFRTRSGLPFEIVT